jgi:hypothetical protein
LRSEVIISKGSQRDWGIKADREYVPRYGLKRKYGGFAHVVGMGELKVTKGEKREKSEDIATNPPKRQRVQTQVKQR